VKTAVKELIRSTKTKYGDGGITRAVVAVALRGGKSKAEYHDDDDDDDDGEKSKIADVVALVSATLWFEGALKAALLPALRKTLERILFQHRRPLCESNDETVHNIRSSSAEEEDIIVTGNKKKSVEEEGIPNRRQPTALGHDGSSERSLARKKRQTVATTALCGLGGGAGSGPSLVRPHKRMRRQPAAAVPPRQQPLVPSTGSRGADDWTFDESISEAASAHALALESVRRTSAIAGKLSQQRQHLI
jgi:hypothetical protein